MPHGPRRALLVAAIFLLAGAALRPALGAEGAATERWYELLERGQKLGRLRVVWAPSTWQGRPTIHDTTTVHTVSVRDMLGTKDVFEITTVVDIERGEDGTLWWQRTVVREVDRTITSEVTWTGKGYAFVERLGEAERTLEIAADAPAMVDAEAALSARARAGALEAGATFPLRLLDVTAREVRVSDLRVLGPERVEGEAGPVDCVKVEERDPRSGALATLWLDREGAFVAARTDGGTEWRRVTRERAEEAPARPAVNVITTPSIPPLERVFSADRLAIDLHLQGDPSRPLPAFPDSPWSRVVSTTGSDAEGWVLRVELSRHDAPEAKAEFPVDAAAFARDLEPTVLMPATHPRLVQAAREAIGDAKDLRTAAARLARWVYETLEKQSPEVQQASALEILDSCQGDCSEHALLYVALCRAAGIPARLCSGYVCVGSAWGSHSWAEIWTGAWIGADPTTGEIGTGARYLFFGYADRPDSFPGVVSARAQGRMRFVARRLVEGEDAFDLSDDPSTWILRDRDHGRYVHRLAGLEARGVPKVAVVSMSDDGRCRVRAEGLRADLQAFADQGATLDDFGPAWEEATFAGAPARRLRAGGEWHYLIHSRRRMIRLRVDAEEEARIADLERWLAPTFAPRPPGPPVDEPPAAPPEPAGPR